MKNWEMLLQSLSISEHAISHHNIRQLELWYLKNISRQSLYEVCEELDIKLSLLKREISQFLDTVYEIPPPNSLQEVEHLKGMNAIQYASKQGYDIYLDYILSQDSRAINLATKYQLTPLHLAALYDHPLAVKVLLKYKDKSTEMPLPRAPIHLSLSRPPYTVSEKANPLLIDLPRDFHTKLI